MSAILQSLITLISGSAIWEGFKFVYPDIKRYFQSRIEAKKILYQNVDPIIKSASELYGKVLSLAKEDFATYLNKANSNSIDPEHNKKYILYLFSQFFAQIEFIRLQSQYVTLSKIKKGRELLKFIETIESRKYRIVDRSIQRIIGECLILNKDQKFKVMTLQEFLSQIEQVSTPLNKWITPLEDKLNLVGKQDSRQTILKFGIIVEALINHFDPDHKTIRKRPIYVNKLSPKSRGTIKENLCVYYLPFISNKQRLYK
jgi:hypothetical protein